MRTADAYLEEAKRAFWHWQRQRHHSYVWQSYYERDVWFRLLQWAECQGPQEPRK